MNNKYPTTKPSLNLDFENTKSLDPRITFRRGTPGTYYDGVTYVKAEENLIHYSEDFANAYWRVNQITITTGHSSPDGGSTARKLAPTSGTSNKFIEIESGGSQNDFPDLGNIHFAASVFAKAGEKKYIKFATVDTNLTRRNDVIVDLSDGSIIESINNDETQYSVESAGGDWYRIGITGFGMQQLQVLVLGDDLSTNAAGDGTSGIYLWGAQLEQRDTVTSYTATNGTPITKYQPKLMTAAADHARFDHDPITGESKGLLIEEQRTNLISYSEDFLAEFWERHQNSASSSFIFIQENSTVSPGGETDASKMYVAEGMPTTGGGYIERNLGIEDNTIYDASIYVKKAEYKMLSFQVNTKDGAYSSVMVDLSDGIISSSTAVVDSSIEHVGNGWYRVSFSFDSKSGAVMPRLILQIRNDDGEAIHETNKGLYIWGAQLEQGGFATSYIKTTGNSATRSADNASITGENFSSWYRQDEGSVYSEISTFDPTAGRSRISFGSPSDRIFMANGTYSLYVQSGGDVQVNLSSSVSTNKYVKRAVGLKKNDFAVCFDGDSNILTDSDGSMPFVDNLKFRDEVGNENHTNGHIKKLAYYPQRLTNEQLQNLTK